MKNNRIKLDKSQTAEQTEKRSRAGEWITVTLCLFVAVCYGLYLLQGLMAGISYALKYNQYANQAFSSLYLFGKLGLIVFSTVESGILLVYLRSGMIDLQEFLYFVAFIIASSFLAYVLISYLYGYVNTITQ